jgi:hypothetical protein
MIYANGDIYDG